MLSTAPLLETTLEGLTLNRRGKVRDVYDVTLASGEPALLIVATDRISAFDYVLGSGIPDKGKVLTQLSGFWFERMGDLVPHHLLSLDVENFPSRRAVTRTSCADARCSRDSPIRCRSSASPADISRDRAGRNISRPEACAASSCRRAARIRSPARADLHAGDQGGDAATTSTSAKRKPDGWSARDLIARLKALTLEIYRRGCEHAESKGIIIADTKFEFGLVGIGNPAPTSSSSTKC